MNILNKFRLIVGMAGLMMLGAGGAWGLVPPTITTCFGASAACPSQQIPINSTIGLTFKIGNIGNGVTLDNISFTATLSSGLKVDAAGVTSNGCLTGVITAAPGSNTISWLTGVGGVGINNSCSFTVNIGGGQVGPQTIIPPLTLNSDSGAATAPPPNSLVVVVPPVITKHFLNPLAKLGDTNKLTFTVTNPGGITGNTVPLTGVFLSDSLPQFLLVASPNGLSASAGCPAGSITAISTTPQISFVGDLPVNSNCTFSVDVIASVVKKYDNTAHVLSTNGGNGNDTTDSFTVVGPPILTKSFFLDGIKLNATTTLNFFLTSDNHAQGAILSTIGFTDPLPLGLVSTITGNIGGATATCGGQLSVDPTGKTITLAQATLGPDGNCSFSVPNIQGTTTGFKHNITSLVTSNFGSGAAAIGDMTVLVPPTLIKTFSPSSVGVNGITTASFLVTNPNTNAPSGNLTNLTFGGATFNDLLPLGMVVDAVPTPTISCGGTFAPLAGATSLVFNIPILPAGASCTLTVRVKVITNTPNPKINCATITSGNGGEGPQFCANLPVLLPPITTKTFLPTSIARDGTSTITITIKNPNLADPLSGIGFTDNLMLLGLKVVINPPTNPAPTNTCGGILSAIDGATSITLSNGSLTAGLTCAITVDVRATVGGVQTNSTGPVSSIEAGPGDPGIGILTVILPPVITKSFLPTTIEPEPFGISQMTLSVSNPNTTTTLQNVNFDDTLVGFHVVPPPIFQTGTCGVTSIFTASSNLAKLSLAAIPPGGSCTFVIPVASLIDGVYPNSVQVKSTNGGDGNTATAILTVARLKPAILNKSFTPPMILASSGLSVLIITITNPNASQLNGVVLDDPIPANVIPNASTFTSNCGATLLGSTIHFSGSLAAGFTCTISVNVSSTIAGNYINTVTSSSTNGGASTPASAPLQVITSNKPPVLIKAFATKFVLPGAVVALTFTLSNPSSDQITNVGFTDVLPGGFLVTNPNGLVNTCGGVAVATPTTPNISLTGVTMLPGASCTLTLNVTAPNIVPPVYICNTTSTVTWSGAPPDGNPATTCITVGDKPIAPPDAFQIRYAAHLDQGDSYINLTNNGANGAPYAGPGFGYPVGNICVNAYVFSPDEQLISCCSCLVTPNGLNSLSVKLDLVSNTLTGLQPNSVVIKLLASQPVGPVCNAALPNMMNLAPGMNAWGTTIHQTPTLSYTTTETPFIKATLSDQELASITNRCANNIGNGSGFGICRSCRAGGFAPIPIAGLPENR